MQRRGAAAVFSMAASRRPMTASGLLHDSLRRGVLRATTNGAAAVATRAASAAEARARVQSARAERRAVTRAVDESRRQSAVRVWRAGLLPLVVHVHVCAQAVRDRSNDAEKIRVEESLKARAARAAAKESRARRRTATAGDRPSWPFNAPLS